MVLSEDLRRLSEDVKNNASDETETHSSSESSTTLRQLQSLHVSFDFVQVREYERSVVEIPCVSTGGSHVGINWTFIDKLKFPVMTLKTTELAKESMILN